MLCVYQMCTFVDQIGRDFTLEDVGRVIHMLMGDFYLPLYLRDPRYASPAQTDSLQGSYLIKQAGHVSCLFKRLERLVQW